MRHNGSPSARLARKMPRWLSMKVAVPTWAGRISPVFDVAKSLTVVDVEGHAEIWRQNVALGEAEPRLRAKRVAHLGVNVLVCGAISRSLEAMLVAEGVQVILHVCGPTDDVLRAFISGHFTDQRFLMPGCCRRGRRDRSRQPGSEYKLDTQGEMA